MRTDIAPSLVSDWWGRSKTERRMSNKPNLDELELSDAELLELIKNHGIDRRSVMKALGVGTVLSFGAGSAAAKHDEPHPPHIDSHFGYAAPKDERLPGKLRPDHTVELHFDGGALMDGDQTTLPFHFEPMGLQVEEGDIIRFDFTSPEHTVTAYHPELDRQRRVPDGVPPFSSPAVNQGGFWLYQFDSPGLWDLFCVAHEVFGMVIRIVVGDPSDPGYDGTFGPANPPPAGPLAPTSRAALAAVGITSWPFPTAAEVFATNALTESNIVANSPVTSSDVEADL